jgi:hypothetical protein
MTSDRLRMTSDRLRMTSDRLRMTRFNGNLNAEQH